MRTERSPQRFGRSSFTGLHTDPRCRPLEQNFTAFMDTIVRQKPPAAKGQYVRTVAVSSTMGPGFRIDTAIYR